MQVGTFLKKCRLESNLSQTDLAFELHLNQSDISKIETNRKEPAISLFKDWTIQTQSMELGIAFLYGTELLTTIPDVISTVATTVTGVINLFY